MLIHPSMPAAVVGHLGGDLLDQVDLAVGLQLGQAILEHHGAVLGNLDDVAHGHAGILRWLMMLYIVSSESIMKWVMG